MKQNILLLVGSIFLIITLFSISINSVTSQEEENNNNSTSTINNNSDNFTINIREISSYTEKDMIALLSSNDEVQVKK